MNLPNHIEIAFILLQLKNKNYKTNICSHTNKKHYGNGLCSSCYHTPPSHLRQWLNWCRNTSQIKCKINNCDHPERPHRARNMCAQCYTDWKRIQKQIKLNEI